ncbi:hypothetical protein MNB_SV-15-1359 [hydrothermal vent metagenome]|uniref:Uncharacterized protein n=1 Tax=hydrothermal vent metagenome TaxID=652676 RepID=A0A1W1EHZ6_9ZZZZ
MVTNPFLFFIIKRFYLKVYKYYFIFRYKLFLDKIANEFYILFNRI